MQQRTETTTRSWYVLLAVLVLLVLVIGFAIGHAAAGGEADTRPGIETDEPGWDCHTMGNRECGPIEQPRGAA
ncbi:MAG: hypothetical protein ACRDPW_05905 [Mycobacteriales bacterium]